MKVLVTGAAGFIGSTLVDELIRIGYTVICVDNESAQASEQFYWNQEALNYRVDIADYEAMRPLFDGVDFVFHLAAESRIQPTLINPLLCFRTNAYGTGVVLQCSREAGVKKVMYSSTSSAYGLANKAPLVETMPTDCLNPYSVAKVAGESMCRMYTELFGLKTIIFRYFNIFGPREPLKGAYAPVVGLFMRQYARGEPFTIVGDGTQSRDFTYVGDAVRANIKAMEIDNHSYYGKIFNVGTGRSHSILELAEMVSKTNPKVFLPKREGEAYVTLANIQRMKDIFNWEPTGRIEKYILDYVRGVSGG